MARFSSKRIERGEIPLQLVAVPHHERHPPQVVALTLRRHVPEDAALPGCREQQPGEHLQGRRLSGAVRPRKPTTSPASIENEIASTARTSRHVRLTRPRRDARSPALALGHAKDLRQTFDFDDPCHDPPAYAGPRADSPRLADVSRCRRAGSRHLRRPGRSVRSRIAGTSSSARWLDTRAGGKLTLPRACAPNAPPARPDVVYAHFLVPSGLIAALGTRATARRDGARQRRSQHRRAARHRRGDAARGAACVDGRLRVGLSAGRELEMKIPSARGKTEVVSSASISSGSPSRRLPTAAATYLCVGALEERKNVVASRRRLRAGFGEGTPHVRR